MSKTKVSKMMDQIAGVLKDAKPSEVLRDVRAFDLEPDDIDATVLIKGAMAGKVKVIRFESDKVVVTVDRLDNGHPEGVPLFPDDPVTLVYI